MASIEVRGSSARVVWRFNGAKHSTTWPDQRAAFGAKRLVEARGHAITSHEVYEIVLGITGVAVMPTFAEWSEEWLQSLVRPGPSTRAKYKQQLRQQIIPAFGHLRLDKIDALVLRQFLNDLKKLGFRNATVTRYWAVISQCLRFATDIGRIQVNPCKAVRFVRDEREQFDIEDDQDDHVYLNPWEFDLILAQLSPTEKPFVEFLAGTGARISEATAVCCRSVLTEPEPTILIKQAHKSDGKGGRRLLGIPKGRQRRWVSVGQRVVDAIAPLLIGRDTEEFLFTAPDGGPIDLDNWRKRVWDRAVGAARRCPQHPPGQPPRAQRGPSRQWRPDEVSTCDCAGVLRRRPTPHDLRHSHACWLLSNARPVLYVSRRLGHTSTKVTEGTYGGLLGHVDPESAAIMDQVLPPVKRRAA